MVYVNASGMILWKPSLERIPIQPNRTMLRILLSQVLFGEPACTRRGKLSQALSRDLRHAAVVVVCTLTRRPRRRGQDRRGVIVYSCNPPSAANFSRCARIGTPAVGFSISGWRNFAALLAS